MWLGSRTRALPRRPPPSRGTPAFDRAVYRVVCRVPYGKVVTYGQVAAMAGRPRAARAVGRALRALGTRRVTRVPWHRVVNGSGRVSPRDLFGSEIQRERLEEEGVSFDVRGRLDLTRLRWDGRPIRAPRARPARAGRRRVTGRLPPGTDRAR